MTEQNSVGTGSGTPSAPPEQTSLRHQAMQRASQASVPRTLTPHEWELYYTQHGVPRSHRRAVQPAAAGSQRSLWQRLFRRVVGGSAGPRRPAPLANCVRATDEDAEF